MKTIYLLLSALVLGLTTGHAMAESVRLGGDIFAADGSVVLEGEPAADIFAAGESVTVRLAASGNAHVAARRVEMAGPTAGDVYATGMTVIFSGATAGRVYAAGYEVRLLPGNRIDRGARLAGRTVAVDGEVTGSVMAAGEAVALAGTIEGDAWLTGDSLTISPDARIAGDLHYQADSAIQVPEGVVAGSIFYEGPAEGERAAGAAAGDWNFEEIWSQVGPGRGSFFVMCQLIAGIVIFVACPDLASRIRYAVERRTGGNFLWGLAALGILIGSVIVTAITVIGIPLSILIALAIPLLMVAAFAVGAVGWVLLAARSLKWTVPYTGWARLLLALAAVVPTYLIISLPIIGWTFSLATTLLGLGALVIAWRGRDAASSAAAAA